MLYRRAITTVASGLAALALAACGGDDGSNPASAEGAGAEDLVHTHGLGVNPKDGALYIATHNGLFKAPKGDTKVEQVGESTQDIMGFSVVGADRFVGSGHPAPGQNLPPNLGLIESRDGGRTWDNVSLLGEADFHVLRSAGERVYGFDGTQGRLMVSRDGGQAWDEHAPPAGVFDLAIDPKQPDRIVASTEKGVFSSQDAGDKWRPLNTELGGLLAWPAPDALYLVDGQGQVHRSGDGGMQFEPVGQVGGQPVAFTANGSEVYVALADGTVKLSTDGGQTWTVRAAPS